MEKSVLIIIFLIMTYVIYKYFNKLSKLGRHTDCFCTTLILFVIFGIFALFYLIYHYEFECHKYHDNISILNKEGSYWILIILLAILMLFSQKIYYLIKK